jgi:hypothetical protein
VYTCHHNQAGRGSRRDRPTTSGSGDQWRWNAASIEARAAKDGFDASTVEGHRAWYKWRYGGIAATLDGTSIRASIEVERKPAAETAATGLQRFAGPAPLDDPIAVYLPPPTVATPAAIERAVAIAEGRLVELPTNPTARAIIAADRKARGESDPGDKPL